MELPREPLRMADPYDTSHRWNAWGTVQGLLTSCRLFLPLLERPRKSPGHVPLDRDWFPLPALHCKTRITWEQQKRLTASPFAPSFPGGPGEPTDPWNNNRIIVSTILTPVASARTRVTRQDKNKEWGEPFQTFAAFIIYSLWRTCCWHLHTLADWWAVRETRLSQSLNSFKNKLI